MLVSRPLLAACLAALLYTPAGAALNDSVPGDLASVSIAAVDDTCGCLVQGPDPVSAGTTGIIYTVAASPGSICSTVVEGAGSIEGPTNGSTILVNAGLEGFFTIRTTVETDGCTTTCSRTVDITANLASTTR